MKKFSLMFLHWAIFESFSFATGVEPLKQIITQQIFGTSMWPKIKQELIQAITYNSLPEELLDINHITLKDIDPSGISFKGRTFTECIFQNLDFRNVDLYKATFNDCTFKDVQFNGQELKDVMFIKCKFFNVGLRESNLSSTTFTNVYFDHNTSFKGAILSNDLTLNHDIYQLNPPEIIRLYSQFMDQGEINKAEGLNKILPCLCPHVRDESFCHLNLKGINLAYVVLYSVDLQDSDLTNANLYMSSLMLSNLKRVRLSENLQLPEYQDINELFELWINANEKDKPLFQKLINARANFFENISNEHLKNRVNWQQLNLSNSNFTGAQLQNINLANLNFQYAYLNRANLEGSNLTNTNLTDASLFEAHLVSSILIGTDLTYANLWNANLMNAQLSETITIPEYQHINEIFYLWKDADKKNKNEFNRLLHAQVHFFRDISQEEMQNIDWKNKDFSNANLSEAQLNNLDLTGINLQHTSLAHASLQGCNLTDANLERTDLPFTDLTNTNLTNANLENTTIYQEIRLSENFILPEIEEHIYSDEQLIEQYLLCPDQEAKQMLKQILIAKKIDLNEVFEIMNTE